MRITRVVMVRAPWCDVAWCSNPHYRSGLCAFHYQRRMRGQSLTGVAWGGYVSPAEESDNAMTTRRDREWDQDFYDQFALYVMRDELPEPDARIEPGHIPHYYEHIAYGCDGNPR